MTRPLRILPSGDRQPLTIVVDHERYGPSLCRPTWRVCLLAWWRLRGRVWLRGAVALAWGMALLFGAYLAVSGLMMLGAALADWISSAWT